MQSVPRLPVGRFQRMYQKSLLWAAILLLEFHMLHCPYRELVKDYRVYMDVERWFGVVLVAAALIYLFLATFIFHSMPDVKAFLLRFRSFEQYFLLFYFFWYIITVALRQHFMGQYHYPSGFYFSDNDWWMFITGLIAFIMFPLATAIGNEKMEKLVPIMLKIVLIPNILFHAWALWQYLQMRTIVFPSGSLLETYEGVSMAIGANRNSTGAYSVTMSTLCLYLVVAQKTWHKIPYLGGMIVYYAVMILSNCRTSWYACLITLAVAGFLYGWFRLQNKKTALRIGVGLLISVFAVSFLFWARPKIFTLADNAMAKAATREAATQTAFTSYPTATPVFLTAQLQPSNTENKISAIPMVSGRTYETGLSQREPLYRASIYVMTHSKYCFLLGVTPSDVGETLYGVCGVTILEPHAHNFFLQMGMSYGVPTMILTIAFVVSLAIRSVRVIFLHGNRLSKGAWMIPIICLCMLSQDMMEAFLNSGGTMVTVAFYLFAGWTVELNKTCFCSSL